LVPYKFILIIQVEGLFFDIRFHIPNDDQRVVMVIIRTLNNNRNLIRVISSSDLRNSRVLVSVVHFQINFLSLALTKCLFKLIIRNLMLTPYEQIFCIQSKLHAYIC
jgi:hypothetical protein